MKRAYSKRSVVLFHELNEHLHVDLMFPCFVDCVLPSGLYDIPPQRLPPYKYLGASRSLPCRLCSIIIATIGVIGVIALLLTEGLPVVVGLHQIDQLCALDDGGVAAQVGLPGLVEAVFLRALFLGLIESPLLPLFI